RRDLVRHEARKIRAERVERKRDLQRALAAAPLFGHVDGDDAQDLTAKRIVLRPSEQALPERKARVYGLVDPRAVVLRVVLLDERLGDIGIERSCRSLLHRVVASCSRPTRSRRASARPAMASAPAGSGIDRLSSKTSLMATQVSSVPVVITRGREAGRCATALFADLWVRPLRRHGSPISRRRRRRTYRRALVRIASMGPRCWRRISMPMVPSPAMTSGSS